MRYAILDGKTVANIIVADQAFCDDAYPGAYVALADGQWCDIGATWDGKAFTPASDEG